MRHIEYYRDLDIDKYGPADAYKDTGADGYWDREGKTTQMNT